MLMTFNLALKLETVFRIHSLGSFADPSLDPQLQLVAAIRLPALRQA